MLSQATQQGCQARKAQSSSFSKHISELASPSMASQFKHANCSHPNNPEIKAKGEFKVLGTSRQHLLAHGIGTITPPHDRNNRSPTSLDRLMADPPSSPGPSAAGPTLLQPQHIQSPKRLRGREKELKGGAVTKSWTQPLLNLLWVPLLNFSPPPPHFFSKLPR